MHPSGLGTSHLAAYSPTRLCRLRAVVLLPATLEPVLIRLAVGHGGFFEGVGLLFSPRVGVALGTTQVGTAQSGILQGGITAAGLVLLVVRGPRDAR